MTRVFCYSPINGQVWATDTYCYGQHAGSLHPTVFGGGWCCPIDVGGATAGAGCWCYVGTQPNDSGVPGVASVGIRFLSGLCASQYVAPWTLATQVDLYQGNNGQGWIGSVLFGHLIQDGSQGIWNIDPSLGSTVAYVGSFPNDCQCDGCATGIHTHMQRWNGSTRGLSCAESLTEDASWIYYWDF